MMRFISPIVVGILAMIIIQQGVAGYVVVNNCTVINSSGYYVLNNSVFTGKNQFSPTSQICIDIQSDNVTLNGNGSVLFSGVWQTGTGIRIVGSNVEIGNVTLGYWNNGILTPLGYSNVSIFNCSIFDNNFGIYYGASNGKITNNAINLNNIGIAIFSNYSKIFENKISGNFNSGFYMDSYASFNLIYSNYLNNTVNVNFSYAGTNFWNNSFGGNFWFNPSGTGYSETCTDADNNGICDQPYNLTADWSNVDYLPLKYPQSALGAPVYSLSGTIYYSGNSTGVIHIGVFNHIPSKGELPLYYTNISAPGVYSISLPNGTYYVGAFMDVNGNSTYDLGEPFGVAINRTDWLFADAINVSGNITGVDIILFELHPPFCTGNCTFYEENWSITPEQNVTLWMIRVNSTNQTIKYDDGVMNGSWSIGKSTLYSGRGHALRFTPPYTPFNITSISIYGKYYCNNTTSYCNALLQNQTFSIWILNSSLSAIYGVSYRYVDFFDTVWKWVNIPIPNVTVNGDFYVFIDTNSSSPTTDWYTGIYIGYDVSPTAIVPPRSYIMRWERTTATAPAVGGVITNLSIIFNASYPYIYHLNTLDVDCDSEPELLFFTKNGSFGVYDSGKLRGVANFTPAGGIMDYTPFCTYFVARLWHSYDNFSIQMVNLSTFKIEDVHNIQGYDGVYHVTTDLNLDGKPDSWVVVAINISSNRAFVELLKFLPSLSSMSIGWYNFLYGVEEVHALPVPDYTGDGIAEVVLSFVNATTRQEESWLVDGNNGSILWKVNDTIMRVWQDVDGDGYKDMLARYSMISGKNGSLIYSFSHAHIGGHLPDLNGDGIWEFVTYSKNTLSSYDGIFRIHYGNNGSVMHQLYLGYERASYEWYYLSNLSSDLSNLHLFVSGANSSGVSTVLKLNLTTGAEVWRKNLTGVECRDLVLVGDLTGDNTTDVVCYQPTFVEPDTFVWKPFWGKESKIFALNGRDGGLLWNFTNTSLPFIGDFNRDGKGDIVMAFDKPKDADVTYYVDNLSIVSGDSLSSLAFYDPIGYVALRPGYSLFLKTKPAVFNKDREIDLNLDGKPDMPVVVNPEREDSRIEVLSMVPAAPPSNDTTPPSLAFVSPTPANDTVSAARYAFINITSNESLKNATLHAQVWVMGQWGKANNSGFFPGEENVIPMQKASDTNWFINISNLDSDIIVRYYVTGEDLAANVNKTELRYLTISGFAPKIEVYPVKVVQNAPANLTVFISEGSPDTLKVYRNGTLVYEAGYSGFIQFNLTLNTSQEGVWNYTIWANDTFGNANSTSVLVTVRPLYENLTCTGMCHAYYTATPGDFIAQGSANFSSISTLSGIFRAVKSAAWQVLSPVIELVYNTSELLPPHNRGLGYFDEISPPSISEVVVNSTGKVNWTLPDLNASQEYSIVRATDYGTLSGRINMSINRSCVTPVNGSGIYTADIDINLSGSTPFRVVTDVFLPQLPGYVKAEILNVTSSATFWIDKKKPDSWRLIFEYPPSNFSIKLRYNFTTNISAPVEYKPGIRVTRRDRINTTGVLPGNETIFLSFVLNRSIVVKSKNVVNWTHEEFIMQVAELKPVLIPPPAVIDVIEPAYGSKYTTPVVNITVVATKEVENWSFNLDGKNYSFNYTNFTFANATLILNPGKHWLVVYAIDKQRNASIRSKNVSFYVVPPVYELKILAPFRVYSTKSFNATFVIKHVDGIPLENASWNIYIYDIKNKKLVDNRSGKITYLWYKSTANVSQWNESFNLSDGLYNITFVVGDVTTKKIKGHWLKSGASDVSVFIKGKDRVINGTNATIWVYLKNAGSLKSKDFNLNVELPSGNLSYHVLGLWPGMWKVFQIEFPVTGNVTVKAWIDLQDSNLSNNNATFFIESLIPHIEILEIKKPHYRIWSGSGFWLGVKYKSNVYAKGYAIISLPSGLYLPAWVPVNRTIYTSPKERWTGWWIRVNKTAFGTKNISVTLILFNSTAQNSTSILVNTRTVTVKSEDSTLLKPANTTVIATLDMKSFDVPDLKYACSIFVTGQRERVLKGLEYLVHYEHGCVEQTTSPLLASYKIWKYYRDHGLLSQLTQERKTIMNLTISRNLDRLRKMQSPNYTWDVWGGAKGEDALPTLYALYGIARILNDTDYGYLIGKFDLNKTVLGAIALQKADGSWRSKFWYGTYFSQPVLTGMAIFDFNLSYSFVNTTVRQNITTSVSKAVNYLLNSRVNDTCWKQLSSDSECDAYTTAFAVMGLIHSGNTSVKVRGAVANATEWLISAQQPQGYWQPHRIYKAWNPRGSRSEATAVVMQALMYAHNYSYYTGSNITDAIEKARRYLIGVYEHDGSWGYTKTTQEAVQALIRYSEFYGIRGLNITLNFTISNNTGVVYSSKPFWLNTTYQRFNITFNRSQLPPGNYSVEVQATGEGTAMVSAMCIQQVPFWIALKNVPKAYIDPLEENISITAEVGEGYAGEKIPVKVTVYNPSAEPVFMPVIEIPFLENTTFSYSGSLNFCMGRNISKPICENVSNSSFYVYPEVIENGSSFSFSFNLTSAVHGNRSISIKMTPMYNPGLITTAEQEFYVMGYGNLTITAYDGYSSEISANISLEGPENKSSGFVNIKEGYYNVSINATGYLPIYGRIRVEPGSNEMIARLYRVLEVPEVVLSETDTRLRSSSEVTQAGYRNFTAEYTSQGGLATFAMESPEGYILESVEINDRKPLWILTKDNITYAAAELTDGSNRIVFSYRSTGGVRITDAILDRIIQEGNRLENYSLGAVDLEEVKFETLPNGTIKANESRNAVAFNATEINKSFENIKPVKYVEIDVPGNISYAIVRFYYYQDELPDNVDESSLAVYRWSNNNWSSENITVVDRVTLAESKVSGRGYLRVNLTHFSVFGIAGEVKPSGGGGVVPTTGGGGGGAAPSGYEVRVQKAEKEKYTKLSLEPEKAYDIYEVEIKPRMNLYNARLKVEAVKKLPSYIAKVENKEVYRYLKLSFSSSALEEVKIRFRVNVSWLRDKDINPATVRLLRYSSGRWQELETEKLRAEDSRYILYEATSPGFSYFAIAGEVGSGFAEEKKIEEVVEKKEKAKVEIPEIPALPEKKPAEKKMEKKPAAPAPKAEKPAVEKPAPSEKPKKRLFGICGPSAALVLASLLLLARRNLKS